MKNKAQLLACTGDVRPGPAFLLGYRSAVLLALRREGRLGTVQYEQCVSKLTRVYSGNKNENAGRR